MMKPKRAIEEKARNELNYRKAIREVSNCQTLVRQQSDALKKSACELEQNGRHTEALTSVRFSRVLSNLDQRIGSYLQKLSFCHTMLSVGNGLNALTDMCNGLVTSMKRLPLGNLMNTSTGGIESALMECEQFMDRVDLSMPSLDENPMGYAGDPEDEKELEELLREERRNECQRITKLTDSHFEKVSQKG